MTLQGSRVLRYGNGRRKDSSNHCHQVSRYGRGQKMTSCSSADRGGFSGRRSLTQHYRRGRLSQCGTCTGPAPARASQAAILWVPLLASQNSTASSMFVKPVMREYRLQDDFSRPSSETVNTTFFQTIQYVCTAAKAPKARGVSRAASRGR